MKTITQKGSIAIISMLLVSAVTLILVLSASEGNLSGSYEYLNKHSDQIVYNIAEGCLEEAMIRIEKDVNFSGGTIITGDATCTITVTGTDTKNIAIETDYLNYTQNYNAQVTVETAGQAHNVNLLNWTKIQ